MAIFKSNIRLAGMARSSAKVVRVAVAATLMAVGAAAQAAVTNFSTDVDTAIASGLAWQETAGAYSGSAGNGTGLSLLALLEKRQSSDQNAEPQGYANASVADKALMDQAIAWIIANHTAPSFWAYRDGADMMALSVYLLTGGPNPGALGLLNTVFDRSIAAQETNPAATDFGYWCYTGPTCADSSTTQLVVAGLAAARSVYSSAAFPDAARLGSLNAATDRARTAYADGGTPGQAPVLSATERGHGYNLGNANSLQQTASGLWIQLVGGADVNDPSVQGYIEWLRNRYGYPGNTNATGGWTQSWAYYLWSSSKAFEFIDASGVTPNPGNLGPDDIGTLPPGDAPAFASRQVHLDPATVPRVPSFGAGGAGYYDDPAEPARVYFDYAYNLLGLQAANGVFNNPPGNSNWDNWSRQAYALLILQRSTGGGCVDSDGDGVCDSVDNCVSDQNPGQEDSDSLGCPNGTPCPDGVGDVCDNCPDHYNPDQDPAACENQVLYCDVDDDGDIDRDDLRIILRARNQMATGSDDPRDADQDGWITTLDVRECGRRLTP